MLTASSPRSAPNPPPPSAICLRRSSWSTCLGIEPSSRASFAIRSYCNGKDSMTQGKIGRFTSPADREKFEASYDEGMRLLPEPAEVHDVPTEFGQVRAYRFGEGSGVP